MHTHQHTMQAWRVPFSSSRWALHPLGTGEDPDHQGQPGVLRRTFGVKKDAATTRLVSMVPQLYESPIVFLLRAQDQVTEGEENWCSGVRHTSLQRRQGCQTWQ